MITKNKKNKQIKKEQIKKEQKIIPTNEQKIIPTNEQLNKSLEYIIKKTNLLTNQLIEDPKIQFQELIKTQPTINLTLGPDKKITDIKIWLIKSICNNISINDDKLIDICKSNEFKKMIDELGAILKIYYIRNKIIFELKKKVSKEELQKWYKKQKKLKYDKNKKNNHGSLDNNLSND